MATFVIQFEQEDLLTILMALRAACDVAVATDNHALFVENIDLHDRLMSAALESVAAQAKHTETKRRAEALLATMTNTKPEGTKH